MIQDENLAGSGRPGKSGIRNLFHSRKGIVFGIAALAILAAACGGSSSADLEPAPDFSFTAYQGEGILGAAELKLSDLRGRPVVLNFWAGLCPPCRAEIPDIQEFADEFGDRVVVLGLDVGPFTGLGSLQDGIDLLDEFGVTYPVGTTPDPETVQQYRVLGMPSTYFITADGKIFKKWSGALNKDTLARVTEDMLANAMVSVSGGNDQG